jgi:hypothetical protein
MSHRSEIEHLQKLALQLSPTHAELINRLERTRLMLEFTLAGVHSPTQKQKDSTCAPDGATATNDAIGNSRRSPHANERGVDVTNEALKSAALSVLTRLRQGFFGFAILASAGVILWFAGWEVIGTLATVVGGFGLFWGLVAAAGG